MGAIMSDYLYEYDNPYKILAHHIVGFYRPEDVIRTLTDNIYIATIIKREVRDIDIGGPFLDCVIEDILAKKKRMEYMGHLDALSKYYYTMLDKARLREEIKNALIESGIEIDYSTGGNDSSANA